MPKPKSLELFINLFETIEHIGIDATSSILLEGIQKKHTEGIEKSDREITDKVEFIIKAASKLFGFNNKDLLFGRTNHERTNALAICFFICNKKVKLNGKQIAKTFQKSMAQVSRGIKRIQELDDDHPADKDIKDKYFTVLQKFEKEYC